MGIFIHLNVSKSVRRAEWRRVYEESLELVAAFPLYEKQKRMFLGEGMYCAVPTKEREWFGRIGWHTIGDSETFQSAEDYFLPKDLFEEKEGGTTKQGSREDADQSRLAGNADILMSLAPMYTNMSWEDERCTGCFELWGNKTQGENYHIYLLAIACMIEDRLDGKAVVFGDITRGQCVRAVELANRCLSKPIRVPCSCDAKRLYERVRRLPLRREEILPFYFGVYQGKKDAAFGAFVREHFSAEETQVYWQERFAGEYPDTMRYERVLHEYLTLGFELDKLCRYVRLTDDAGREYDREFVEGLMRTEMFVEEKDCEDWLEIDTEEERPYGIYTLLAQFAFAGARNRRVERFIPLNEIQKTLQEQLGSRCDVNALIADWLRKEEQRKKAVAQGDMSKRAASDRFKEKMQAGKQRLQAEQAYDITTYRELMRYKTGDRVRPELKEELFDYYRFYQGLTEESRFGELMEKDDKERGLFIIRHNESVLLMEEEWRGIFARIREDKGSFERYYPMVRVRIPSQEVAMVVRALVLNDELFDCCRQSVQKPGKESET